MSPQTDGGLFRSAGSATGRRMTKPGPGGVVVPFPRVLARFVALAVAAISRRTEAGEGRAGRRMRRSRTRRGRPGFGRGGWCFGPIGNQ